MNLLKTSFVTILFFISVLFQQQSAQESTELKEATTLTESVVALAKEGKFNEALPLAKRALEIRERLLPRNDPLIGASLSYLADLYRAKRDYGMAKATLQRLLQMQQEQVGSDDASVARVVERLALVHLSEGNLGKAEDEYKRALEIKEKKFGPDSIHVADTLTGLATVYRASNNFSRGAPLFKRALAIYGKQSGVESPAFHEASEGFSCFAHETGNRDEMKALEEIWKQFAPPGSPPESPYSQLNAKALSLPKPDYPGEAKVRRVSGTVIMKVRIDENGRVVSVRDMCQGPPLLVPGSLAAVRNARFKPATISGKPVPVDGIVTYRYVWQ